MIFELIIQHFIYFEFIEETNKPKLKGKSKY